MSADLRGASTLTSAALLSFLSTLAASMFGALTGPGPPTFDAPLLDEYCSSRQTRHAASASPSSGKAAPLPFIS